MSTSYPSLLFALRVCFAGVAFALGGCVTVATFNPQQTILAADRVELPTLKGAGPLSIEAKINGVGPFRFVVDTG
ncbi:MAG: hypothetical protein ABIR80_11725, partial [Opitutaceae bacterium]